MKKKIVPCIAFLFVVFMMIPALSASAAVFNIDFETKSKGIYMANLDTDTVVYEKDADLRLEPASCTKIMTYIVAVEHISDLEGTKITVSDYIEPTLTGTGNSMAGVITGEELTALQLLNLMMVPSGNDASLVLAEYVGGLETGATGEEAVKNFVQMMNDKAAELGLSNTHFNNPHGLHDDEHYTTASDLYQITKYALTLPHFSDITSQTFYTLPATNKSAKSRTVYTTNKMISENTADNPYYYQYAKGIKTGSHDQAGYCLVSSAVYDGYTYICVALGAPSVDANGKEIEERGEMIDSKNLYRWAFTTLEQKDILKSTDTVAEVKIDYVWNQDRLLLSPEKDFSTILPSDVDPSSVMLTTHLPEKVEAPVKKGDVIGTATLSYANQELTTINLVAAESMEKSQLLQIGSVMKDIFSSLWFIIIAIIIGILLIVYITLTLLYKSKKKKMRKVKKYRKM